jgi:arabinogalactan oligomer/maltooligosaccharide transport system permease protein
VIQLLISRFGGLPATILKIALLSVVNALAIWAIPAMASNGSWVMMAFIVVATIALDYLLLTKRFIPAKYVVIGAIFLTAFQIIPIIFTIFIAFTNYSTGNIGTKPDAIEAIVRDSVTESDNSQSYDMLPATNASDDLVLILTPQAAVEETPAVVPGESTDPGTTEFGGEESSPPAEFGGEESSPPAEFGGEESSPPAEFGGEESSPPAEFGGVETPAPSASSDVTSGTDDLNVASDTEPSSLPPTYIGTSEGLDEIPVSDVTRDEFGTVTEVTGFPVIPDTELPAYDAEISAMRVPGPNGGYISPQGYTTAIELTPTLEYDEATDTFTSVQTGDVYVDAGRGAFVNETDPEDSLEPGWRETVGFENFTSVFTDPQIRDPFISVFVWTFVYAMLSVLLTFVLGLSLAVVLNKEGMKGQRIYRSLLIIPYAVPAFLSILVWGGLLNDDFGAINTVTGWTIPWLFDPFWAKVSILLVNLWLGFPYMFLVSTGALQAIPAELQEAARVDGARNFQVWRMINMPLLLVALTPLLIASFAFNFNNFNNIYLLTGGGPSMEGSEVAGATDILISYTFKIAFSAGEGNDYGLASAISIYIFFIVGTISLISFSRSKALREERP